MGSERTGQTYRKQAPDHRQDDDGGDGDDDAGFGSLARLNSFDGCCEGRGGCTSAMR